MVHEHNGRSESKAHTDYNFNSVIYQIANRYSKETKETCSKFSPSEGLIEIELERRELTAALAY